MFKSLDSIASVVGIFMYLTIFKFKQVLRSRKGLGKVSTTTLNVDRHLIRNLLEVLIKQIYSSHMLSLYNAIPLRIVTWQNQDNPPSIKQIAGDHLQNIMYMYVTWTDICHKLSVHVTYCTWYISHSNF